MRYRTFCLLGALGHGVIAVAILLVWLLLSGCARKAPLPNVQPPLEISIGKTPPATGPKVEFRAPEKPMRRMALDQRAKLGIVFFPDGLPVTCENLKKIRACGFERVEYIPQDAALHQCAEDIGLEIALTYQGNNVTVDWVRAHPEFVFGPLSLQDEPNPDTCPVVSTCYTGMQDVVSYANQHVPSLGTMITLSAYAAFDPPNRWQTYAKPYYEMVSNLGLDYFAWCWHGGDYNTYRVLINNTRQYGGLKPITFYSEGMGTIGNCGEANSQWLQDAFWTSSGAGAAAVVWFWAPGSLPFGSPSWRVQCQAADEITGPPSDIDASGEINMDDYQLALSAHNGRLADRIAVALNLKRVFLPMVHKG